METNSFETALFAAEIGDQAPTIDLHGHTVDLALSRLDSFLHHELLQGTDAIKIIHGRGGGWLREAVLKYLREQQQAGLVGAFREATDPRQNGAVTLAALTRIRSNR